MNVPCPECGTLNLFCQVAIPYYVCSRCSFGHELSKDYEMKRISMGEYHEKFKRLLADIETDKMIQQV